MKNERIFDALEKIDEELIAEAAPGNKPPKKAKTATWAKRGAMAACALVLVGVGVPHLSKYGGKPEEPMYEGNRGDVTSSNGLKDEAGVGEFNEVTMTHMEEIRIRIDEMLPDGFCGTIEVGTDLFKEGEQITVVAQDNVTVVQQDGSIFAYDELEPNIKESDLEIGSSVWVGFQTYDYVEGNGKYNQIFAYHVDFRDFPNWGLFLSVKEVTKSGLTLVCTQSGGEPTGQLQTGSDYKLMVLKDAWEEVPTVVEECYWTRVTYMLPKDNAAELEIKWEWLYGKLPAGTYRIVKEFTDFRKSGDYDKFAYWAEFEIQE